MKAFADDKFNMVENISDHVILSVEIFNPVPNDKFKATSKLNEFADDSFKFDKKKKR